jgi:hypothetical protein
MTQPEITEGNEYTLRYTCGDGFTIQVRAESSVWENTRGIRAFDATLLEPMGNTDAGEFHIMQTHLFEVVGE